MKKFDCGFNFYEIWRIKNSIHINVKNWTKKMSYYIHLYAANTTLNNAT